MSQMSLVSKLSKIVTKFQNCQHWRAKKNCPNCKKKCKKYVKILRNCQKLSKIIKICQNLSKFVKIVKIVKIVKNCQKLSKIVKNCQKM